VARHADVQPTRRHLKPGDLVRAAAHEGIVVAVDARELVIERACGTHVSLPTAWLDQQPLQLLSPATEPRSLPLALRLARHIDLAAAAAALVKAAEATSGIADAPAPEVRLIEIDDQALTVLLSVRLRPQAAVLAVKSELLGRVAEQLRIAGIDAPRTASDIHLRDLDFVRATVQRVLDERARQTADKRDPDTQA
jgi:small-conductance mechanosensitive channel